MINVKSVKTEALETVDDIIDNIMMLLKNKTSNYLSYKNMVSRICST